MKRLLLAATLGLTTLSAHAVCPSTLNGKYVGSGQYTEQQFINGVSVLSYIEIHVMSVVVTPSSMTVLKEYFAATGANGPALPDTAGAAQYTFDKNTCTGQLGGNNDPMYFAVSDSGRTIKFIHGKGPKDPHLAIEAWELTLQ
jgi:hypothetical protein